MQRSAGGDSNAVYDMHTGSAGPGFDQGGARLFFSALESVLQFSRNYNSASCKYVQRLLTSLKCTHSSNLGIPASSNSAFRLSDATVGRASPAAPMERLHGRSGHRIRDSVGIRRPARAQSPKVKVTHLEVGPFPHHHHFFEENLGHYDASVRRRIC
ncbi:hypothetical protein EVAR_54112_1 [Eumeta japonica]|uniref:Uncharacterized protein n=1 Tax=Eumeta variegata TaxID=151549 RepID=A0A4C1Z0S8_EUMVA|nr:hypothetical protein EVAR_54112_1 [Eumeta japonica]